MFLIQVLNYNIIYSLIMCMVKMIYIILFQLPLLFKYFCKHIKKKLLMYKEFNNQLV